MQASPSGQAAGGQKEITLREDLDLKDRTNIYKDFLHHCLSGSTKQLSMGTSGETC